jgi:hypothetical protein
MYSLEEFPVEILYNTLQYVNTKDLVSLIQVNRRWESIVYQVCYKRVQNLMDAGWTVMVGVYSSNSAAHSMTNQWHLFR